MKYMEHDIQGDFNYCCGSGDKLNEFSIFANIIAEDGDSVTLERFQKFGELKLRDVTLSRKDFEMYYQKIEPDEKERSELRQQSENEKERKQNRNEMER